MTTYHDDPYITQTISDAVNELLDRNSYTRGVRAGELYLGRRILVVRLVHPVIIEGTCTDVSRTADLFDLINQHQENQ